MTESISWQLNKQDIERFSTKPSLEIRTRRSEREYLDEACGDDSRLRAQGRGSAACTLRSR